MVNFTDYNDFFLFLGGLLVAGSIICFLFRRFLQDIFISEEEIAKLRSSNKVTTYKISFQKTSQLLLKKISLVLLVVIVGVFLLNQFLLWKINSPGFWSKLFDINITLTRK